MKFAFLCPFDPGDEDAFRKDFSGTHYHMLREFERQGDTVRLIGPVRASTKARAISKSLGVLNRIGMYRPPLAAIYNPWILDEMAKTVTKLIGGESYDFVMCQHSIVTAHYSGKAPIFYWRDANFADLQNSYRYYNDLNPLSTAWARRHEERAMEGAFLNLFSSECSRTTALGYGIPESKVDVVPYGANHELNITADDVESILRDRSRDALRLLFIGIDWERKGGPLAVEVCKKLNDRGVPASLDIVGSSPAIDPEAAPFVRVHGFLAKSRPEDAAAIRGLLERAHFLIHPAQAEAYGCVLCEACSFGVPIVATAVGGIPTIIRNDVNGRTFAPGASADDYVNYLQDVFSSHERYQELARGAFREYEERLNWRSAVTQARRLIHARLDAVDSRHPANQGVPV